ncbi:MAG: FtsX-like permease family protein [Defluviitaleaceae bacterium]|nr:FtsX-like permease family protein [Defluviitaleaceae bacterium]
MNKIIINKSLRSIWRNKKSYFSGIFVLVIGLGMFIGMFSGYLVYMESVRLYHLETNYADVFASVRAMPLDSVDRLTRIDGVAESQGILKHDTNARLAGFDDLIGVRLIGIDENRPLTINQFSYTGESIREGNDILVSSAFYNAHGLHIGDTIRLLIGGQYENFTIRGTVLHPEYLFVPNVGGGVADDSLNTVGFVQVNVVETVANMQGAVNNVRLVLDESVTFEAIEPYLIDAMERYGMINMVSRYHHGSYMAIIQQSTTFSMMAILFPSMFLTIAIGMLYVTLKRLITMERTEIGTLKAMGFSGRYIVSGYLLQGTLAAIISFLLALVFGWFVGGAFYNLIAEFWDLAWLPFVLDTTIIIAGFFIALGVSLFGVIMGAKSSLGVQPAEAMREAPPSANSAGSKFNGIFSRLLLNTGGKLAIRSMQRNKRRVLITVVSIALVFTLMNTFFTMGQFMSDITDDAFLKLQVSDGTITLNRFESRDVLLRDIGQMQGVLEVETVLAIPVELENNGVTRTVAVSGVAANATLFNIFDNNGSQLWTDSGGIILSRFFADELGVTVGESISVYNANLRTHVYVEVTQLVEAAGGMGAYMEISQLSALFSSEPVANMLMINVEEGYLPIIFDSLADAANISGFSDNERAHAFARINADMNNAIFNIINLVSVIICFAIIYNISNIALGEKQREYATLRVLGFQANAVTEINTFEYVIMLILGTILGIIFSYFNIPSIGTMFSFEQSIISVGLSLVPTAMTFVGVAVSVAVSCFLTGRQIRKFNLVDVLKER